MAATEQQLSVARRLGVQFNPGTSAVAAVAAIEQKLGKEKVAELCRWYLMSVYRYLAGEDWQQEQDCTLGIEQQQLLVTEYLRSKDAMTSVRSVLRDDSLRYTLLHFAKVRNARRYTVSIDTHAFRRAEELLQKFVQIDAQETLANAAAPEQIEDGEEALNVVDRRARRRAAGMASQLADSPDSDFKIEVPRPRRPGQLSDEDYAALAQELEGADGEVSQGFTYRSNEDRWSLVLGIISGLVFVFVLGWLFF